MQSIKDKVMGNYEVDLGLDQKSNIVIEIIFNRN